MYKPALLFALFGAASAVLAPATVSYSSYAAPAPLLRSTAPVTIQQPVAYAQPLLRTAAIQQPVAYAQPLVRTAAIQQPVAYAQPLVRTAAIQQPITYAQPLVRTAAPVALKTSPVAEPFDPNPQYNYGYSVSDALTGDSKSASETRDGDVVKGQYSLVEPDGSIRTVTYTSDQDGFKAVVDRQVASVKTAVATPVVANVPVQQQIVARPVAALGVQAGLRVASPIAVQQVASPIAVQRVASPIAVQRVASPIAVQRVASPIAVQRVASPIAVQRVAPVVSTNFGSPFVSYSY